MKATGTFNFLKRNTLIEVATSDYKTIFEPRNKFSFRYAPDTNTVNLVIGEDADQYFESIPLASISFESVVCADAADLKAKLATLFLDTNDGGGGGSELAVGTYANSYFDDGIVGDFNDLGLRIEDNVSIIIDNYTGEQVSFNKITGVTDLDVDGVIIRKKDTEYFKRVFTQLNVKWFGAIGNGLVNDAPAIQECINLAILRGYKSIFLPSGIYRIDSPLIMANWNGSQYSNFSIDFEGQSSFWEGSSTGTRIVATHKNTFALGIQRGKGVRIKNIAFSGGFTPPALSGYNFYKQTFAEFTDVTCRDTQYSPYTGLVIDPFSNSALSIPADGGYPGLTSYYRGSESTGGSTGVEVRDCQFFNFVVGVFISPNGFTQNAELIKLQLTQYGNNKICVATSQAQEKSNEIVDAACWSPSHTFFMLYGLGVCGTWHIKRINIAGALVRFMSVNSGGYFPVNISEVFSESMGQFGTFNSLVGGAVKDSELGFAWNGESNHIPSVGHINSTGILFENCNIRMYGSYSPCIINGNSTYSDCIFEAMPIANTATLRDCSIGSSRALIGATYDRHLPALNPGGVHVMGNFKLLNFLDGSGIVNGYSINLPKYYYSRYEGMKNCTITGTQREISYNVTADEFKLYEVGENAVIYNSDFSQFGYGFITALSGTTVTIKYLSENLVSGNMYFYIQKKIMFWGAFIGNVTSGSPNITSCVIDHFNGHPTLAQLVGFWVDTRALCLTETYSQFAKIIAVSGTTVTLSHNSLNTKSDVVFSNAEFRYLKQPNANSTLPANMLMWRGSELFLNNAVRGHTEKYVVFKDGKISGSPQAEWFLPHRFIPKDVTITAESLAPGASSFYSVSVPGAKAGDIVQLGGASLSLGRFGSFFVAYCETDNQVEIQHFNASTSATNTTNGIFKVKVFKGDTP